MEFRSVVIFDSFQIAEIYNHFIATSHATFEIEPIDPAEMENRIRKTLEAGYPFLVCESDSEIIGYAYGRQFRARRAYRQSTEVTIYIKPGHERRRIGTQLYENLIAAIKKGGFHAVIAGISLPNDASINLHEEFGFEKVAHFREVGYKFGKWI